MTLKEWLGLSTRDKARAADNFYMKLWVWLFVGILIALSSTFVLLHLIIWTVVYYLLVKALWQ